MISRKSSIAAASLLASPCRISSLPLAIRLQPAQFTRRHASTNGKLNDDVLNSSFCPFAATSDPRYSSKSRVNPPSSTLPAPIDIPDRGPNESLFRYAITSGRKYWAFYKTGLKNIFANYKGRKAVIAAANKAKFRPGVNEANAHAVPCSRAEFQLVHRAGYDLRRVPIFGLLLLLLGEWTPIIVVFFTPLVPFTCRIPRQINKQIIATEARRREAQRQGRSPSWSLFNVRSSRHAAYVKVDDVLLKRDGKVEDLRPEELRLACFEREIDILGRSDGELRRELSDHLDRKR